MKTYLISEEDVKKITSKATLANGQSVTLYSAVTRTNRERTYYKIELTQSQVDKSIKSSIYAGCFSFHADILQGYDLNPEIVQLGITVGTFQYTNYVINNRINEECIFSRIQTIATSNDNQAFCNLSVLEFALTGDDGLGIVFDSDGLPTSVVYAYYNPNDCTFSVKAEYEGKLHDNVLEDFDDPIIKGDDIASLLYYLNVVMKAKSNAWMREGRVI